jgi:hypothetical protein
MSGPNHRKLIQLVVIVCLLSSPFVSSGEGFFNQFMKSNPEDKQSQLIKPENVQGCYELGVLKWDPELKGEDAVFIAPPARIQILAERGTKGFENGKYLVRPAPGVPPSIHRASFWKPVGPKTIEIVWTTGFSGLTMKLSLEGDTLKGKASTFWDFPRGGQTAPVVAPKVDCNQTNASH